MGGLGFTSITAADGGVAGAGYLRFMYSCCPIETRLLIVQYSCRPAANGAMKNMNSHGISANTCCCTGSICAGESFCCSHMVTPSRIGSTPNAIIAGGCQAIRPNRFKGVSGSGADRSVSHNTNGW